MKSGLNLGLPKELNTIPRINIAMSTINQVCRMVLSGVKRLMVSQRMEDKRMSARLICVLNKYCLLVGKEIRGLCPGKIVLNQRTFRILMANMGYCTNKEQKSLFN
jgi:hypothetical protein